MTVVVLFGAESTGKTQLGRALSARYGTIFLPEFGRSYCEINGTDCTRADLLEIGDWQQKNIAEARDDGRLIISDTDALMTAAWAYMMLGDVPQQLLDAPKAELYLFCRADTPFIDDGLRVYGNPEDRDRFDQVCENLLVQHAPRHVDIRGDWDERMDRACEAVEMLIDGAKLAD